MPVIPLVIGVNVRSSSLAIRERLFLARDKIDAVLSGLRAKGCSQTAVISTCDRTEVVTLTTDPSVVTDAIVRVLGEFTGVAIADLRQQVRVVSGEDAVRHLFRIAASLESAVIGEPYVLGQVKDSLRAARDAGSSGADLESLMQAAFFAAKRVRSETGIGTRSVSVAAAAVDLARGVHGDLKRRAGLLIGSGDMGATISGGLLAGGLGALVVLDPLVARAANTARMLNCHVDAFESLAEVLPVADIVVCDLGNRHQVVSEAMVRAALHSRRQRPMFFMDLAVPADVDRRVERIDGVFLYSTDDLERIAREGREWREGEAEIAQSIVDEEVAAYLRERDERGMVPALMALRSAFEEVREGVIADAGGDAERATQLLINRILHRPSQVLRELAGRGQDGTQELEDLERIIRMLFLGSDRDDGKTG